MPMSPIIAMHNEIAKSHFLSITISLFFSLFYLDFIE